ncbi:MAG: hypothetical protein ABFC38_06680 [Methanospirillum sp.]
MSDKMRAGEKRQKDPFDRAEFAAEIAGMMKERGEAELSGVARYHRMAGVPAKKALELAALQVADMLVRYLSQGWIKATVEEMEAAGGGPGTKAFTVAPAKPLRVALPSWDQYVEFVVRANGFELARPSIDFRVDPRIEVIDEALRRWPDGGYELTLGRARFGCRIFLKQPGGDLLIGEPKTREFQFAEPISFGGGWTLEEEEEEEEKVCPYGLDAACPLRTGADVQKRVPRPE